MSCAHRAEALTRATCASRVRLRFARTTFHDCTRAALVCAPRAVCTRAARLLPRMRLHTTWRRRAGTALTDTVCPPRIPCQTALSCALERPLCLCCACCHPCSPTRVGPPRCWCAHARVVCAPVLRVYAARMGLRAGRVVHLCSVLPDRAASVRQRRRHRGPLVYIVRRSLTLTTPYSSSTPAT